MMDFSWSELFVIIALAIILIGPDEIPGLMVTLGRIVRRLQYVRYAISQQFDDIMRDADLDDIRKSVNFEASDDTDEAAEDDPRDVLPPEELAAAEQEEGENERS